MFKKIAVAVVSVIMLTSTAFASVTDDVKRTVEDVIRIVADKEMQKTSNEQKRRDAIKKALSTVFDHQEMAKRSLGRHWNQRTPEERKQFVELFARLLENSYAGKIESYSNEKIVYGREFVEDGHAEVRSKVVTARRDEYTLDYKLIKQPSGKWVVYDVVIEGSSLVSNYRTQFNRIITANGYQELLKKMQSKNNELKAQ